MNFKDYFHDELAYIKSLAETNADELPHLIDLFANASHDPDMMKLFESFAFLTAKTREKIEDAFPELTQNLLAKVFPLPLRALPSTTIMQFTPLDKSVTQLIPQDSCIKCNKKIEQNGIIRDEIYLFQTCRDILISPIKINYVDVAHSQLGTQITLTLMWNGATNIDMNLDKLHIFLGTNQDSAQLLKLWFNEYLTHISLLSDDKWITLNELKVNQFMNKEDCILPVESEQFWRLQLISEYFSLPHVNDFITLEMNEIIKTSLMKQEQIQLRFSFNHVFPNQYSLNKSQFLLNCVPAINLFDEKEHDVPFTMHYLLDIPDNKQFHSITNLYSSTIKRQGESSVNKSVFYLPATQFSPNYHISSEHHLFYSILLKYDVIQQPQVLISFINSVGQPNIKLRDEHFTFHYKCLNRYTKFLEINDINDITSDIPCQLDIKNITKPSDHINELIDSNVHWNLLSHLSLSALFLSHKDVVQNVLDDFNFYTHIHHGGIMSRDKRINGIVSTATKQIDWIVGTKLVRGFELSVVLDSDYFSHVGEMYNFGRLLAHVFAFCITEDSFLKVNIIDQNENETWSFDPILGSRSSI